MPASTTLDMASLEQWIGNTEAVTDLVTPRLATSFHATLDRPDNPPGVGEPVPSGFHWLLCPPIAAWSQLGEDGHPARGGFLPPVPLPRRMWAGSRLRWHADLCVGDDVTRTSTVASLTRKQGRSGDLVFLGLEHRFTVDERLCLAEQQDVVYREMPPPGNGAARPGQSAAGLHGEPLHSFKPDAPMLFRYSAITFNGHRIHYDADYCREVEGYPGCIIHGPLLATTLKLAADALANMARVRQFSFKARSPAFLGDTIAIHANGSDDRFDLQAVNQHGTLIMEAVAEVA